MSVSNHQAADSLHEIKRFERRSATAYGYRKVSPHLIIWGVVWIIGYSLSYARPQWWELWPVLCTLGIAGDFAIAWHTAAEGAQALDWRIAATLVTIFLFICAVFAIIPPNSGLQVGAFIPILVALFYSLLGIWMRGIKMVLLGLAVGALTVGGYFGVPHYFAFWMAGVGGGALLLGGIWLKGV
jgi:hypothetical protein